MRQSLVGAFLAGAVAAPALAGGSSVLLLGDGQSDAQVEAALEAAGHVVVAAGLATAWDGAAPDPSPFDLVVILAGSPGAFDLQASADSSLHSFVAEGGGLLLTEWAARDAYTFGAAPAVSSLLPVASVHGEQATGATWTSTAPSHPLTADLPSTWDDGNSYSFALPVFGAIPLLRCSNDVPLLTYREDTGGPVIHLNHDMAGTTGLINPNALKIIVNAASFATDFTPIDCDGDGTPDHTEIAGDAVLDINGNGLLDACEPDCDDNGLADDIDAAPVNVIAEPFALAQPGFDFVAADDDLQSDAVALPWPVTIGGVTLTRFVQDSNGYVELLRDGDAPIEFGYGTVADLTGATDDNGWTHTYLMAAYDDLTSLFHGRFGYRVDADRVVFYWNEETYCDRDDNLLNEFELVLFADGSVRWNFNDAKVICFEYDLFTGVYAGYEAMELVEAISNTIPEQASWSWSEADGVETEPFAFTPPLVLDWSATVDDGDTGVEQLPWAVPIGGSVYVAFVQDANGYVELLRAGEQPIDYGFGPLDAITTTTDAAGHTHTVLMAAYDDLSSERYGLFGYRIESDRVIYYWNTETFADEGQNRLNAFELVLYAGGRITWMFDGARYHDAQYDLYSGVYLGHTVDALYPVADGFIPHGLGWSWIDDAYGGSGSDIDSNGILDLCEIELLDTSDAAVIIDGGAANDRLGHAVSGIGDVDGDGVEDYVVGAYLKTVGGQSQRGRVYVYAGADHGLLWSAKGQEAGDQFGFAVAAAGDTNGDAVPDVIVGARRYDDGNESDDGRAYVYSGDDGALLWTFTGGASGDLAGAAVAGLGDVNGDDLADVVVGAYGKLDEKGRVYVLSGTDGSILHAVTGAQPGDRFGYAVAGIGDAGIAGTPAFAVGAYRADTPAADAGTVSAYAGSNGAFLWTAHGDAAGDGFGIALAGTSDGRVVVGARYNDGLTDDPADDRGQVQVLAAANGATLSVLTGLEPGGELGAAVAALDGDFDGDGVNEFLAGASQDGGIGRAFVYTEAQTVPLVAVVGEHAGDQFGSAVAGLATAGSDGPGLLIGAKFHDGTAQNAGRAYIFATEADGGATEGDVNGDGLVNGADLGFLLGSWGPCSECAADLTGDGVVNGADLGLLLGNWTG